MRRRWAWLVMSIAAGGAAMLAAQDTAPRTFMLAGQVAVELGGDWVERRDAEPPPLPLLITSAPKLNFSDVLVLENREARTAVQLALSDNPFVGRNAPSLDEQFHAPPGTGRGLHEYLFYFFFAPPRACVERGRQEFERRKHEQELNAERDKDGRLKAPLPALTVSQPCTFLTTVLEMYAEQVSAGVTFRRTGKEEAVEGRLLPLYLPPMEQVETGGRTYFVFEGRAERMIERAEIDKYGLPEEMRGARAHFFWALGAPTPFPFLKDPARKDVQLLHVVYACLSQNGDARKEFLQLLRRVH